MMSINLPPSSKKPGMFARVASAMRTNIRRDNELVRKPIPDTATGCVFDGHVWLKVNPRELEGKQAEVREAITNVMREAVTEFDEGKTSLPGGVTTIRDTFRINDIISGLMKTNPVRLMTNDKRKLTGDIIVDFSYADVNGKITDDNMKNLAQRIGKAVGEIIKVNDGPLVDGMISALPLAAQRILESK